AIAAMYIRKRRPMTKHVRMVTATGAPAAMSCVARICAAPENITADKPNDSHTDAPADCAPTPQTRPNGSRPRSGGDISRTPARKSGREKIRDKGCARGRTRVPARQRLYESDRFSRTRSRERVESALPAFAI